MGTSRRYGIDIATDIVPTKLGFLAPFIMTAKCLFQELWQIGIDWDESIPAPFQDTFANWVEGIKVI